MAAMSKLLMPEPELAFSVIPAVGRFPLYIYSGSYEFELTYKNRLLVTKFGVNIIKTSKISLCCLV